MSGDAAPPPDVHPVLRERWSPRRFAADREVSADELLSVLQAARWAPSSGNEQPWRFVVLPREDPNRTAVEDALKPGNGWAKRASVLVVCIAKETRVKGGARNGWAEHDLGIATGYLLAQAAAIGLSGHAMGGWLEESLRAAVEIPPDHRPMSVVALGHHDPGLRDPSLAEREAVPRARKPLGEIAFLGRMGGAEPLGYAPLEG